MQDAAISTERKGVEQQPKNTKRVKIMLLVLVVIGFVSTFVTGLFLSRLLSPEQKSTSNITPTAGLGDDVGVVQDSTKFLPGKYYFDDTIMLVSQDKPTIDLVATVTRIEQDKGYSQSTRISFYDGNNWDRQMESNSTSDSSIVTNKLVKSWKVTINPSRVLKQTVEGKLSLDAGSVSFTTDVLQNEIGIRSLPGYTKFLSNGTGILTINGTNHNVYVLYTRIYSLNAKDIQFYNQPLGLTTDYIAFWDDNGNFYHADVTSVAKPTDIYQTHQLGVFESADIKVQKTFSMDVKRDSQDPPVNYDVKFGSPVGLSLNFDRINGINKAPNSSYTWYMGGVEGKVNLPDGTNVDGLGLVEYIHE